MTHDPPDENLLKILEWLAGEGYLQNNHKLKMRRTDSDIDSRMVELICSMKNLETLDLLDYRLSPEILAHLFQSCSKITHIRIMADTEEIPNTSEHLKNQMRPGFQRLRYLHFQCYIEEDTYLVLQEILT
jgi:hypothetical protein